MDESESNIVDTIKQNISDKKYQAAVNLSREYLENHKSSAALVLQVDALIKLKQYVMAKELVMEEPNSFVSNLGDFLLLVKVLVNNNEFIKAREVLISFEVNNEEYFENGMKMLNDAEKMFRKNSSKTLDELAKQYYHASSQTTLYKQKKAFMSGQHLPYKEFVKYSRFVLMDPFVQLMLKSEIIDTLRKINFNDTIEINWIDNEDKKIVPNQLSSLDDMSSYQYILKRIISDYQSNPEKMYLISSYFNHQSILMYPFNDDIIKDFKNWYDLTIQEYLRDQTYDAADEHGYLEYIKFIKDQFNSIK